jgi:hypothetical protein
VDGVTHVTWKEGNFMFRDILCIVLVGCEGGKGFMTWIV